MYEHFYGFKAKPFDESTDTDFFYLGDTQQQALSKVHEGLNIGGGFIVVTGLSGMGKTSLVKFLQIEQVNSDLNIASISGNHTSDHQLLPSILNSFNCIVKDETLPALIANIESFIHAEVAKGKKAILVVDEAQNLSYRSLEVLRLLSNFKSNGSPSFQVILVGDSTLNEKLMDENHHSLKDQIVSATDISPMALADTKNYVMHHLKRVGWLNKPVLNDDVFEKAQQETAGIPAEVNQYFDRLLYQEMENTSHLVNPLLEKPPQKSLTELNKEELLAALRNLEAASQASYDNSVEQTNYHANARVSEHSSEQVKAMADEPTLNNIDPFAFDADISLEETKRAFEGGSGTGGTKKSNSWLNWQLVGILVGSYLLSAVIAVSFYYSEVAVVEAGNNGVILADNRNENSL